VASFSECGNILSNRQRISWLDEELLASRGLKCIRSKSEPHNVMPKLYYAGMRHLCQSASVDSTPETPHAPFLLAVNSFTVLMRGTMKIAVWERPEIMTCRRNGQWIHVWGNRGQLQTIKKQTKIRLKRILGQECALEVRTNGSTSWIEINKIYIKSWLLQGIGVPRIWFASPAT